MAMLERVRTGAVRLPHRIPPRCMRSCVGRFSIFANGLPAAASDWLLSSRAAGHRRQLILIASVRSLERSGALVSHHYR